MNHFMFYQVVIDSFLLTENRENAVNSDPDRT